MKPFVDQDWLLRRLSNPTIRVVDCRFVLGSPNAGRHAYQAGHIAGAAFLDLDTDLSDPVGDGTRGRHPLPSLERFMAAARRAGISNDSSVVAYDAGTGGAARLWWLLRHFGHDDVHVLDADFDAWEGPVRAGEEDIAPGDFEIGVTRTNDVVDLDDVAARLRRPGRVLVDARASPRYRGEVEPIDLVAGHIPGAVNAPFDAPLPKDIVTTDDEVVVYCGSGVTASLLALRLAAEGREDVKLYAGSYSEWVNRGLPVDCPAAEQ